MLTWECFILCGNYISDSYSHFSTIRTIIVLAAYQNENNNLFLLVPYLLAISVVHVLKIIFIQCNLQILH